MPIPPLTAEGLLPPGVHDCSLAEIRDRFAPWPLGSANRRRLMLKLEEYVNALRGTTWFAWVAVDGSFTSGKAEPNDIDLVVVVRGTPTGIPPVEYNLLHRRRVEVKYGFDILLGNEDVARRHLDFFQKTRDGAPKGILRVVA